jgi:hypothetical protein
MQPEETSSTEHNLEPLSCYFATAFHLTWLFNPRPIRYLFGNRDICFFLLLCVCMGTVRCLTTVFHLSQ